jgi:FlaA1/EpsC-like NDP-sugar epimerase
VSALSPDGAGERVVVTGATGSLGQQIVRVLLECLYVPQRLGVLTGLPWSFR